MKTNILKAHQIDEAVDLLKRGQLVALPTETVYGLAADARNEMAIQRIFKAKGRPSNHPLILHIDSPEKLSDWAKSISAHSQKLADNFWPGPLSMVLNKQNHVSSMITGGLHTIAIRLPKHPLILNIIKKLGNGVVAPSANAYQKLSPTQPIHVLKTLEGKIPAILDGGNCSIGIESTIIDMTKDIPTILRHGAITKDMIENVLKMKVACPMHHHEKTPGNMKNHYQTEKPLFILTIDQIEKLSKEETNVAIVHYSKVLKKEACIYYPLSTYKEKYAENLYNTLHLVDNTKVEKILVEKPPHLTEWMDIFDRLTKASRK